MAKHYINTGSGATRVGATVTLYKLNGTFTMIPHGPCDESIGLGVKQDGGGNYIEPPISDAEIEAACASIILP